MSTYSPERLPSNLNEAYKSIGASGSPGAPGSFSNLKSVIFAGEGGEHCSSDENSTFSDKLSISAWVKVDSWDASYRDIVAQRDPSGENTVFMLQRSTVQEGSFRIYLGTDSSPPQQGCRIVAIANGSDTGITSGSWAHIMVTYDQSAGANATDQVKFYANAVPIEINVSMTSNLHLSLPNNSLPFLIGGVSSGTDGGGVQSQEFGGNIKDVSLFTTTLSETDIARIYNEGTPGDLTSEDGLFAWWRMGDGTGDSHPTISDQIGSLDLTMNNMESGAIVEDSP